MQPEIQMSSLLAGVGVGSTFVHISPGPVAALPMQGRSRHVKIPTPAEK